jgi:hypothetical protein
MAIKVDTKIMDALNNIHTEVVRAKTKHPGDFHNYHEAFAVINEEVDELWDEVKAGKHDPEKMRLEAIQIAAMCVRLITELPKQK